MQARYESNPGWGSGLHASERSVRCRDGSVKECLIILQCRYIFISVSKKIVDWVVAEHIEPDFPIVSRDQGDSKAQCDLFSSANRLKLSKEKTKSSTQLLWGGWKFNREVVNRKKSRNDNQHDLRRTILCSKMRVPAICELRGIWVSRSERRKGVASHLLDPMRKTFCTVCILSIGLLPLVKHLRHVTV